MTRTLAFCYAEELEHASAEALLDLLEGIAVDGVAVALTYHRARRVLPRHGRVSLAPATSFACDPAAYGALAPVPNPALHDRLLGLRAGCADRGLAFHAWLVALHSEPLARARPDLAAQSADGTPTEHALCPSHDDVVEYCAALVGDVARQFEPNGIELEAALYPGWEPAYTLTLALEPLGAGAPWAAQCFCGACERLLASAGVDAGALRARALAAAFGGGPEPEAAAVAGARATGAGRLLAAARAASGGAALRVLGFGTPERLALQGLTGASARAAGGVGIGTGTTTGDALERCFTAARAQLAGHAPLVTANWAPHRTADAFAADARRLARAGASALGLYNLSLVPDRALAALRAAAAAFV